MMSFICDNQVDDNSASVMWFIRNWSRG